MDEFNRFDREKWIKDDCVFTHSCSCDVCPYVIFDENGSRKCEKEIYEECKGCKE